MNFMESKKPSAGTIARLICLVLAAANQVFLLKTGHSLLREQRVGAVDYYWTDLCSQRLVLLEEQLVDQRGNRCR